MPVVSHAVVVQVYKISDEIHEYYLKPDMYIGFEAGQFLQLSLELVNGSDFWPESRTFSIASHHSKDRTIRLIIKRVGKYTTRIFNELLVGSSCTIKYAYGEFTLPLFDEENKIVCLAGGTGISPFLAFIEELSGRNKLTRMNLFYSVRRACDAIDLERLRSLISQDQLKIFTTRELTDNTINRRIDICDVLRFDDSDYTKHYYICGSKEFTKTYENLLKANGITQVYVDEW